MPAPKFGLSPRIILAGARIKVTIFGFWREPSPKSKDSARGMPPPGIPQSQALHFKEQGLIRVTHQHGNGTINARLVELGFLTLALLTFAVVGDTFAVCALEEI